jgi:hypothetical protein
MSSVGLVPGCEDAMDDPEVAAMDAIAGGMRLLDELDNGARERVLAWVASRWGPFPSAAPAGSMTEADGYHAGQELEIELTQVGRKERQARGFLEDGTLVVVDEADHLLGDRVRVAVNAVRRTQRGTMLFASLLSR